MTSFFYLIILKIFGLNGKEKQIIYNQIIHSTQNAINYGDSVSFIKEIYDRQLCDLENCLPEAIQKNTLCRQNFITMPLKEKIELLEKPETWRWTEINGDVIGYGESDSEPFRTDDDYVEFYEELACNPLYSALVLLEKIIEKEQEQQK